MSFTDRKQFEATEKEVKTFNRVRSSKVWCCSLCGHQFAAGDKVRWIYCNSTPGQQTGNFFVCGDCDGTDEDCMARGKDNLAQAIKLAKAWGIYGPDWQRDQ